MRDVIENGIRLYDFMDASDWPEVGFGLKQKRFWLGDEGDPDVPILLVTHFPPNGVLPRHHHGGVFVDAVVQGTSIIDGEPCPAGTLRWFPAKADYGPVVAGPEGCVFVEFYIDAEGFATTIDMEALTPELRAGLDRIRSRASQSTDEEA